MRHTITPCNSQDALKALYVELLQGPDVAAVSYPGFAAVEESSDADGLIYRDLCAEMKMFVLEDPTPESSISSCCLLDPVLDLIFNTVVLREDATQVSEGLDGF